MTDSITHRLWRLVPVALRNRPFGIYVSTVVFALGVYAIFDGPEIPAETGWMHLFITIVGVYYTVAALGVITSLVIDAKKHPAVAIFGEMYGWLFIAAAALATTIIYIIQAPALAVAEGSDLGKAALWTFVWGMLFVTAAVRSLDILITHRGHNS
jgi:hypothetical protein